MDGAPGRVQLTRAGRPVLAFGAVASYETPLRRRALAANQTALAQAHMSDRRSPAPLSSSLTPMARCGDGALRATAEVRPCQG